MRKWAIWIVVVACIAGGVLSFVSLDHYYSLLKGGLDKPSFCNINAQLNCDVVAASSYATLFGQPVAGFGLIYFVVQCIFGVFAIATVRNSDRRPTAAIGMVAGVVGLVYPAYLAWVMAAILGTLCVTCLGMDAALLLVLIGWVLALKDRTGGVAAMVKRGLGGHVGALAVVVGIGAVFLASATQAAYDAVKLKRLSAGEIEEIVARYKKGSVFDLQFNPAEHPMWGNPDAKVTVVEFSDFQCPYCRVASLELLPTLAEFRNQVRFVFVNYPLDRACNDQIEHSFHQYSCLAARAVLCAHKSGKFWEYQEDLFRNQQKLSPDLIKVKAVEHGMDAAQFNWCLDDTATDAAVRADVGIGHHVHITGTPTVLVNNRQVNEWRSREVLRAIIRAALADSPS